jgi:hypothetical protein
MSGSVFNVDSPEDLSIYEEEYGGKDTETGNILSFIEVLNIAEEFFINKDRTQREVYKKDFAIKLLLPYFNND